MIETTGACWQAPLLLRCFVFLTLRAQVEVIFNVSFLVHQPNNYFKHRNLKGDHRPPCAIVSVPGPFPGPLT